MTNRASTPQTSSSDRIQTSTPTALIAEDVEDVVDLAGIIETSTDTDALVATMEQRGGLARSLSESASYFRRKPYASDVWFEVNWEYDDEGPTFIIAARTSLSVAEVFDELRQFWRAYPDDVLFTHAIIDLHR
jgi:hypothetical protein